MRGILNVKYIEVQYATLLFRAYLYIRHDAGAVTQVMSIL